MKTIAELNKKWWYRLLKVFYVLIFLLALGVAVAIILDELAPYMTTDMGSSTVKCLSGNEKTFSFREVNTLTSTDLSEDKYLILSKAAKLCELKAENGDKLSEYDFMNIYRQDKKLHETLSNYIDNSHKITFRQKQVNSWFDVIGASILSFISILLIFEVIKRIFYYIVLGSLRPKKNESDTILPKV